MPIRAPTCIIPSCNPRVYEDHVFKFQQIPKVKFVAEGPSFISRISHSKRNKKYETEGTVYGIINIKTLIQYTFFFTLII